MGLELIFLAIFLLLTVINLYIFYFLHEKLSGNNGVKPEKLKSALSQSWKDLELDKDIGQIEGHAKELEKMHQDISNMLRNPQERGQFGEHQLEVILEDHLPDNLYTTQGRVAGKQPDAFIKSSEGKICIDSKFPLDNYREYVEAEKEEKAQRFKTKFRKDVEKQLEKIKRSYIKPEEGTVDFAFAFIPSESVYYHLIKEENDLIRKYTKQNVQIVSPLTLGHNLELIKSDLQTLEISEKAERVIHKLNELSTAFEKVEDEWSTLFTHIQNAKSKADELNSSYSNLKTRFESVEQLSMNEKQN